MRTCLVVDDSRVIRKVSRHILESLDFTVEEAENGQLGLDKCAEAMPDVILLDWNMPVMTGIEFIVQLRQVPGGDKPKVVFCTTENDVAHIREAISAGADEYVMKPFDHETLQIKLQLVGMA
ncbi:response regulator [Qipengyuania pelagi]|jgi:two-component system, chemotaxis family, chemotaxis protein CheY|uniref:Response regulator n=1 Tax=Qipengyuania pelagi TaxID=994320 RepID=A0A844Y7S6_9SPHN|nr:response regulator [Qipengyuania pelagi]MEC7819392.1 response regulator [Pseudomonadota bacterium]MXO54205.1 response regulator [Qipengyuania pelagi]|tara:strand:- start:451 stop:816 length:366 start_codon:yes stop_codon:yes gene_type:complete